MMEMCQLLLVDAIDRPQTETTGKPTLGRCVEKGNVRADQEV